MKLRNIMKLHIIEGFRGLLYRLFLPQNTKGELYGRKRCNGGTDTCRGGCEKEACGDELKNVTVIMILPYDPFGLERMVYTVKNKYIEEPKMEYEDGAATLFLYTKGTKGVHRMFEIKLDSKTTVCFVGLMERLERSMKEAEEAEGEARGKAEGDLRRLVTLVCKKMKLGQPLEKIAEDLVEEVSAIEPIYNIAGKYEPEYDPELVMKELAEAGQRQEKE